MTKTMKKTTKKKATKHVKKTTMPVTSSLGLMIEGTVYVVEMDDQGKIISKAPIDNDAVLKALSHVLNQSLANQTVP